MPLHPKVKKALSGKKTKSLSSPSTKQERHQYKSAKGKKIYSRRKKSSNIENRFNNLRRALAKMKFAHPNKHVILFTEVLQLFSIRKKEESGNTLTGSDIWDVIAITPPECIKTFKNCKTRSRVFRIFNQKRKIK